MIIRITHSYSNRITHSYSVTVGGVLHDTILSRPPFIPTWAILSGQTLLTHISCITLSRAISSIMSAAIQPERKLITLKITEEQFIATKHFFEFHNWDFDSLLVNNQWEDSENELESLEENRISPRIASEDSNVSSAVTECVSRCTATEGETGSEDHGDRGDDSGDSNDEYNVGDECIFCFCTPCVTTNRQSWLGDRVAPNPRNSRIRKDKYRKFWQMLSTRGAWIDQRYQQKKNRMLHRQNNNEAVWTLREVMPDCAVFSETYVSESQRNSLYGT